MQSDRSVRFESRRGLLYNRAESHRAACVRPELVDVYINGYYNNTRDDGITSAEAGNL